MARFQSEVIQHSGNLAFAVRRGDAQWLEITMRVSARRHERRRLLTRSDRASTTFPCRKSMSASRPCRLKSHGSRRREEPNKHLSVPPPPFLSSTSRAEALEPGLPCLIPRFLCESAHGCHQSEETDIIGTSRRSSVTLER